jgi:hypothetical protein
MAYFFGSCHFQTLFYVTLWYRYASCRTILAISMAILCKVYVIQICFNSFSAFFVLESKFWKHLNIYEILAVIVLSYPEGLALSRKSWIIVSWVQTANQKVPWLRQNWILSHGATKQYLAGIRSHDRRQRRYRKTMLPVQYVPRLTQSHNAKIYILFENGYTYPRFFVNISVICIPTYIQAFSLFDHVHMYVGRTFWRCPKLLNLQLQQLVYVEQSSAIECLHPPPPKFGNDFIALTHMRASKYNKVNALYCVSIISWVQLVEIYST